MRIFKTLLFFLVFMFFFAACQSKKERWIFLSHTYQWGNNEKLDERIEAKDLSGYEMVLIGGDVLGNTTQKESNLNYLKEQLNINHEKVLWAVGNHDTKSGNAHWIPKHTKRSLEYIYNHKHVIFQVFNANYVSEQETGLPKSCRLITDQINVLQSIADTIKQSSQFILLSHLAFWGDLDTTLKYYSNYDQSNRNQFNCSKHDNGHLGFRYTIWPILKEIKEKGVEVIVLAGDFGQKAKRYEWKDEVGIQYLGCGINNSILKNPNNIKKYKYIKNLNNEFILEFEYNPTLRKLKWEFVPLKNYLSFIGAN